MAKSFWQSRNQQCERCYFLCEACFAQADNCSACVSNALLDQANSLCYCRIFMVAVQSLGRCGDCLPDCEVCLNL